MVNCATLVDNYLRHTGQRFECQRDGEYFVITTPFSYYDGDDIQVFVRQLANGQVEVSDLGHTVRKLLSVGIEVGGSKAREATLEAIRRSRGVDFDSGRLFVSCAAQEFGERMTSLVQAMIQVEDIIFTRRVRGVQTFQDNIETEIKALGIGAHPNVRLIGTWGRTHEFDFRLEVPVLTVVKGLSAISSFAADDQANRLLGALTDLRPSHPTLTTVVFLDDSVDTSWRYASGILTTMTPHIYHFDRDRSDYRAVLGRMKQPA